MAFGVPRPQDGPVPFSSLTAPEAAPAVPSQIGPLAQAMNAPPLENKPKMNWLGILADALAGAAGRPGPYAAMMGQQRQLQLEEQLYQNHQQDEMDRQIKLYDYQRLHPNDEITQYMTAAHIDPNSAQGQALYQQAMQNKINPFTALDVQQPDGATVRQYVRPPMAPAAPVGELSDTPPQAMNGGPTPTTSGGFPGGKGNARPVVRRKSK